MIDEIDRRLKDWITEVTGADKVVLSAPDDTCQDVSVFLMDLATQPPGRGSNKPPLSVALRYLVSVPGQDPVEGHRKLWDLLVDAMQKADQKAWTVEPKAPPLELWTALKASPRPAFILKVPAWHEWPPPKDLPPTVKRPLTVDVQPMSRLRGTVVLNGYPMMGALIVLGHHRLPNPDDRTETPAALAPKLIAATADHPRTYSDSAGRFEFTLPTGAGAPRWLLVRVKGQAQIFPFEPGQIGTDLKLQVKQKET